MRPGWAGLLLGWCWGAQVGAEPPSGVRFSRDVAPIVVQKCLQCHSAERPRGSYQMDQVEALWRPGDSDLAPVVPGDPEGSELFLRLVAEDEYDRMPQKDDPLPPVQIGLIRQWILEGAEVDAPGPAFLSSLVQLSHPAPPEVYQQSWPVLSLAFRPGTDQLVSGGYHEVLVWNPEKGDLLRRITGLPQRIQALAFHPAGHLLAVAGGAPGYSGEVYLVDDAGEPRRIGRMPEVMLSVAFNSEGSLLAAGGADNSIRMYAVPSGEETGVLYATADWVTDLAFAPEGGLLLVASRDRSARVFRWPEGELEATYLEHGAPVTAVAWTPDGKRALSSGRDRRIHLWNPEDGRKLGEFQARGTIHRILTWQDRVFFASSDGKLEEYGLEDRKSRRTFLERSDWVYALAFSPASRLLAAGSHDGTVQVWDVESGELKVDFTAAPGAAPSP